MLLAVGGICKILRSMTDALCVGCSRRSALKSAVLCSPLWHVLVYSSVETLRNSLERKPGRIIFSLAAPLRERFQLRPAPSI